MDKKIIYSSYTICDNFEDKKKFLMEESTELCTVEVTHEDGTITYEPSDDDVYNTLYYEDACIWEDIFSTLKQFFKNKEVIFVGTVQLWNGTFKGGKIGKFEDLFNDLLRDCNDWEFSEDENGVLNLKCSHHDGTNYFNIKTLTEKGSNLYDDWYYDLDTNESEEEVHKKIFDNIELSIAPNFYKYAFD